MILSAYQIPLSEELSAQTTPMKIIIRVIKLSVGY